MLGGNKKKYFKKHNLAFSRRSTELVYYSFPVLNPEKIIEPDLDPSLNTLLGEFHHLHLINCELLSYLVFKGPFQAYFWTILRCSCQNIKLPNHRKRLLCQ